MVALRSLSFVTDAKGKKKQVQLSITDFDKIQDEIEDLEDSLELEKAKKSATGFKRWKEFISQHKKTKKATK